MLTVQETAPFVNARGGGQSTALEQVVPPGRAEVRGDAALAIEGVDIHNDGFRIRYALESPSTFELGSIGAGVASSALLEYLHSLEVFDDLGNRYDEERRSDWMGLSKCGGEKSFSPRPVREATALRLSLPHLLLRVGSTGRLVTGLTLGPWQVEVPLIAASRRPEGPQE